MKTINMGIEHVIVSDDILAFDPNSGLRAYAMSISGGFTWPSGQTPGSILVNKGVDVCPNASHAWLGYPETVIYRYKNGSLGIGKFKSSRDIPNRPDVLWAVGGMGLLNMYKPSSEGFCRGIRPDGTPFNYTDVLRKTAHTVLGIKDGKCHLIYIHSKSAYQVNLFMKENGFDMGVMLDGGHIAGINGGKADAKHNLDTRQGYAIQAIDRVLEHRYLVAWDAGHNALNPSNQSPDGTYKEWEANIRVVQKAMAYLANWGVDSIFVDVLNRNQADELYQLVKKINATGADICVSRHSNAASNPAATGQEIFCYKMQGESLKLAQCLHTAMKPLGSVDRGIKDGSGLYVVRETTMPCALVETLFHTNSNDLLKLKSEEFENREALALATGVAAYFKLPL